MEVDVLAEGSDANSCWAFVFEMKNRDEKNLPSMKEAQWFVANVYRIKQWLASVGCIAARHTPKPNPFNKNLVVSVIAIMVHDAIAYAPYKYYLSIKRIRLTRKKWCMTRSDTPYASYASFAYTPYASLYTLRELSSHSR